MSLHHRCHLSCVFIFLFYRKRKIKSKSIRRRSKIYVRLEEFGQGLYWDLFQFKRRRRWEDGNIHDEEKRKNYGRVHTHRERDMKGVGDGNWKKRKNI